MPASTGCGHARSRSSSPATTSCELVRTWGRPKTWPSGLAASRGFGDYLDRYDIRQSEADGATVSILYEGRTTRGGIHDADDIDEFIDLYGLTLEQTEELKKRYATKRHVAEAEQLIAAKAANMLRHYVEVVLPNGFKAQVVATSRLATVRYRTAFLAARDALVAELDALDPAWKAPDALERVDRLTTKRALLVRAWRYRDLIAQLDFVPVISGAQNDKPHLAEWTSGYDQVVDDFKKKKLPMPGVPAEQASPVAMLIVNAMLLTGFDARRVSRCSTWTRRSVRRTCCRRSPGSTAPRRARASVTSWTTTVLRTTWLRRWRRTPPTTSTAR